MIVLKDNPKINIYRIEYYNNSYPDVGWWKFYILASSTEEAIKSLCLSRKINPTYINERVFIGKLDAITTETIDKLVLKHGEDSYKRMCIEKKQLDEYTEKHKVKPSNLVMENMTYSLL